jgi:demethylmenaquinone methyltransferase/2-methoxy-6-polyprenyl-1,4-benzoquinol methylase
MAVKPYQSSEGKKQQVAQMFNNIAGKYDFLNHFLSLGIDKIWRKKAIALLKDLPHPHILDVATGTGDMALQAQKQLDCLVTGVDISEGMLRVASQKINSQNLQDKIKVLEGDSEELPFENNEFDAIMVAFGVRNFENLQKGLREMARVLRPGGRVVILEFSKPVHFPFKQIYLFYFKYLLPFFGGLISKDKAAYTYLPSSVLHFPDGQAFDRELEMAGLSAQRRMRLSMGIATIYLAEKTEQ